MPRGKRNEKNYDAEIAMIDSKIAKSKEKLENLQKQKDVLIADKRNAEMKDIYKFMNDKGLAPNEVLEYLQNVKS